MGGDRVSGANGTCFGSTGYLRVIWRHAFLATCHARFRVVQSYQIRGSRIRSSGHSSLFTFLERSKRVPSRVGVVYDATDNDLSGLCSKELGPFSEIELEQVRRPRKHRRALRLINMSYGDAPKGVSLRKILRTCPSSCEGVVVGRMSFLI